MKERKIACLHLPKKKLQVLLSTSFEHNIHAFFFFKKYGNFIYFSSNFVIQLSSILII